MGYNRLDSPLYKLLQTGRHLRLPKGQLINTFDDNPMVNLIKTGYVKRYLITKDGAKGIQIIYGPHDVFPLNSVRKNIFDLQIYTGPEQYYYESMTDLDMCSVSQSTLQEALQKDPMIYKDILYEASTRLSSNIYRFENMALRVANKKVAHYLAYLATTFGKQTKDGITIEVPLTHQTLAEALNLARETVTHCVLSLEERGIIRANSKNIVVVDHEALKKAAN